jgi:hypothetical protein
MLNQVKPYFFISKYNSVLFAKCVEWDNHNNPKTIENTLSYQEDGLNDKSFYQLFQTNDAIRTQIKSSYENHQVVMYGDNGVQREISLIKRTDNLNISDYRTAKILEKDGKMVVYFGQGNILNESDSSIKHSYDLKQYVPSWMIVGKNLDIEGYGELNINKVVWLRNEQLYGLELNFQYSSSEVIDIKVKSVYNKFEFDVYEFDIDFYSFTEGKYQIEIKATNDGFSDATYLSERIHLKNTHENTHIIIYSHHKNTQINYSWGIQHMMRLEYLSPLKYSPGGDNNIHKTDNNSIILSATDYELYEATLKPLPTAMATKTTLALSRRELFVDTRSYVVEGKPDVQKLGDTNLHEYKIVLTLSNDEYSNRNNSFSTLVSNRSYLKIGEGYLKSNNSGFLIINQ